MIPAEFSRVLRQRVDEAHHILMHLHPGPDGDCVGSTLAMRDALLRMGKEVTVISGDTPLPHYLRHLPGSEAIRSASYGQTELKEFDLFLILDSAALSQITRLQEVKFPDHLRTALIDHHGTNPSFAELNWVDPSYPAACQMVYDLLQDWQVEISPAAALCLMIGIYTDTGGFQYPPTSGSTLRAAAHLAEKAPTYTQVLFQIDNSYSPEHVYYQGRALSNVELHLNGHVAMSVVTAAELAELGIQPDEADKSSVANILKSVEGWDVAVGMVETEPGLVKVSFRTRDSQKYHVGKIAGLLGGGGHPAAAGLTLKMSVDEAKLQVLQAIEQEGQEGL